MMQDKAIVTMERE